MRNKKGETILGLVTANAMIDTDGKIIGIQGIIRDITKQKKLEEQMLQAAKMDSLGRLASGIAHDFNNYLTIINGYSELLLAENEGGKDSENLKIILQAGKNASKLVAKILGFSRRQAPVPAVFDVNATLGELERMARRLLGEHTELSLDLDPNAGNVTMDPGQFEQVLINLVLNARDAMPSGGKLCLASASLMLDEARVSRTSGTACRSLCGHPRAGQRHGHGTPGIGTDLRTVLYHQTRRRRNGAGTGFGIRHHHPEPGHGLGRERARPRHDLSISCCRRQRRTESRNPNTAPATASTAARYCLSRTSKASANSCTRSWNRWTSRCMSAADGLLGLKAAKALPRLDLLFSDVVLPGLSGIEVAERIRKLASQCGGDPQFGPWRRLFEARRP